MEKINHSECMNESVAIMSRFTVYCESQVFLVEVTQNQQICNDGRKDAHVYIYISFRFSEISLGV